MNVNIFNKLFVNRIFANLLMVGLLVAGYYSYSNIRLSLYPDINYAWTNIKIVYPGAQPEIVEEKVTNKIEKAIGAIENVDLTMSVSMDQMSMVYVRTKFGIAHPENVFKELNRVVLNAHLPPGAQKPEVIKVATSSVPVLKIGLTSKIKGDERLLKAKLAAAAKILENQIGIISGISKISYLGKSEEVIQIETDSYKLKEYGLSMDYIARVIRSGNYDSSGGSLAVGNESFSLRLTGRYETIEDLKNLKIPLENMTISLKDIANIKKEFIRPNVITAINGNAGIVLNILKSDGIDTVKLIDEVKNRLAKIKNKLPADIEVHVYSDSSVDILKLLSVLESSSILGLIFVFIVLWITLGFRQATFAAIGIPVSFCFCIFILHQMNASLNQVTLFGFVLVLGIVVDDAIVVIENIYRKFELGLEPYDAVKEGVCEVFMPVLSGTLTTVAAFLPLLLASGPLGNLMSFISVVVCLTLIGSIFECFFILPSHLLESRVSGKDKNPKVKFEYLKKVTLQWSKVSIRHGGKFALGLGGLFLISTLALFFHNKEMFSNEDMRGFRIGIKTSSGTKIDKTAEIIEKAYKLIMRQHNDKIETITQMAGIFEADAFGIIASRDDNYGQIYIELKDDANVSINKLIDDIKFELKELPGISMSWFIKLGNAPLPQNDVVVVLRGDDFKTLEAMSAELQQYYLNKQGFLNVFDDRQLGHQQISIDVDRNRAALYGLTNEALGKSIYNAIKGQRVGSIQGNEGRDEWDMNLVIAKDDKKYFSQIMNMNIRTPANEFISLNEVATLKKVLGPNIIGHYNQKKSITVTATIDPKVTSLEEASEDVALYFSQLEDKFNGTTAQFIGAADDIKASFIELLICFIVAAFLVYCLLALQFNSFSQPFLILLMMPVGLIGVSFSMFVGGNPLSLFIVIGIIGLLGVVVNDSLMMICFINNALAKGKSIHYAVMIGISNRYRPILMTTITTVAGLTPAALGLSGKSLVWQPLAQTFIGGIVFATIGTLFILPYCYLTLHKLSSRSLLMILSQWYRKGKGSYQKQTKKVNIL